MFTILTREVAFVINPVRIRRVDAFDLFPNTPHVETVVTYLRTC